MGKPIIALLYDFDKTLCTKDMQEYAFIPSLGIKAKDFWAEVTAFAKQEEMDRILAYMFMMIQQSHIKKISVLRKDFVNMGKHIEFFDGVLTWFDRINEYAKDNNAILEHYIISSGLKEIIEGSEIKKYFKKIYACEFHYDENGAACWPKTVVNYTTKTQFLFRINKDILDVREDDALNKYIPDKERRIPFRNMVYIGDGLTDVPCMKLVKSNGGKSIAVHQRRKKNKVIELIGDQRVDYISLADFRENKELDIIVKAIIDKIIAVDHLESTHRNQLKKIKK